MTKNTKTTTLLLLLSLSVLLLSCAEPTIPKPDTGSGSEDNTITEYYISDTERCFRRIDGSTTCNEKFPYLYLNDTVKFTKNGTEGTCWKTPNGTGWCCGLSDKPQQCINIKGDIN